MIYCHRKCVDDGLLLPLLKEVYHVRNQLCREIIVKFTFHQMHQSKPGILYKPIQRCKYLNEIFRETYLKMYIKLGKLPSRK